MQAIILAGGKGSRLKPFTTLIPKPLVPISDNLSILEVVLQQLKNHGFTDIILAVNHMSELIQAFFKNGEKIGLNILYSKEDKILGTAGPLSLIDNLEDDFLVMNGDLLTTINYKELYNFHKENKSDITISTYKRDIKIDLGVIESNNEDFINYIEKPTYHFNVSMGIYFFNRKIIDLIPKNQKLDIPDLVLKAQKLNKVIKCYSGDYYWLDIGRLDDYELAIKIFEQKRSDFLPKL